MLGQLAAEHAESVGKEFFRGQRRLDGGIGEVAVEVGVVVGDENPPGVPFCWLRLENAPPACSF
jgi:hypothetical protein